MTNETTASQPKSIGDDAQGSWTMINAFSIFQELTGAMDAISKGHQDSAEIARLVLKRTDKIHPLFLAAYESEKLRTPAAQASATIQAAPVISKEIIDLLDDAIGGYSGGPFDKIASILNQYRVPCCGACPGDGTICKSSCRLSDESPAATIQEPVMVAEPVGDGLPPEVQKLFDQLRPEIDYWCAHRRESNLAALDAIEFRFKVSQARTVRLESTALAAPMVADPAGVALQDLLTAEFECYRPTYPHGLLVWARNALLDTSPHRAATVKAVPSEALTVEPTEMQVLAAAIELANRCADECCVDRRDYWKQYGDSVKVEARACLVAAFAAPLADKTGGGE